MSQSRSFFIGAIQGGVVRLDSSRLGSVKHPRRGLLPLRGGTVKNAPAGSRGSKFEGFLRPFLIVSVPFLDPAVMLVTTQGQRGSLRLEPSPGAANTKRLRGRSFLGRSRSSWYECQVGPC